jgi:hypothetical protein
MSVHFRSICTWTAVALLSSAPVGVAKAQSGAPTVSAKIAVINVQAAPFVRNL